MNNRFVTETEVEEAKKKRKEEWEVARAAGRELPSLEEEEVIRDTRCLYERLQEQKDTKQDAFEEQLKFKNQIYKGLNEEDASFLSMVAKKKAVIDNQRFSLESDEVKEYREAIIEVQTLPDALAVEPVKVPVVTKKPKIAPDFIKKNQKSQAALMGVIRKRKSLETQASSSQNKIPRSDSDKSVVKENIAKPTPSTAASIITTSTAAISTPDIKTSALTSLTSLAEYPSSSEDEGSGNDNG